MHRWVPKSSKFQGISTLSIKKYTVNLQSPRRKDGNGGSELSEPRWTKMNQDEPRWTKGSESSAPQSWLCHRHWWFRQGRGTIPGLDWNAVTDWTDSTGSNVDCGCDCGSKNVCEDLQVVAGLLVLVDMEVQFARIAWMRIAPQMLMCWSRGAYGQDKCALCVLHPGAQSC